MFLADVGTFNLIKEKSFKIWMLLYKFSTLSEEMKKNWIFLSKKFCGDFAIEPN